MKKPPAETGEHTQESYETILNSLDALVYVADMETYGMLFLNDYGRTQCGPPEGRRCWEVLQKGQTGPCPFCTNDHLVDDQGKPTGVHVWEFRNTRTGQWFQCRDQAIRWPDGRLVRIEVAADISNRKQMEFQLDQERRKAEQLATTDMLTGLRNRRAFFTMGEQLLKEATRFNQPVSLIMFDLDLFKQINDRYGHAGDAVLMHFSQLITDTVREADIAARLGGEEFAILLPQTGFAQASHLAERLRGTFDQARINFSGEILHCTASFGIQCTELPAVTSLDELLSQADQKLYAAKKQGRNCTVSGC